MGFKTKLIKFIEQPAFVSAKSRALMIAKYDLLVADELHKRVPFKTLVDVGSASGEYSFVFNRMYPGSKTYSFEPIPDRHKKINDYDLFEIALWNENTNLDFTIANEVRGSSIIHKSRGDEIRKITAKRFDGLDIEIEQPALLKIDVEGAEKQVLEGFGDELSKFSLVILEFNMNKESYPSEIIRIMAEHGFYSFVQKDLRKDLLQSNMFFMKD